MKKKLESIKYKIVRDVDQKAWGSVSYNTEPDERYLVYRIEHRIEHRVTLICRLVKNPVEMQLNKDLY